MGTFAPQTTVQHDAIARILTWVSRASIVIAISLIPLMFIPATSVALIDGKMYLIAIFLSVALVVSALRVLRVGSLDMPASATFAAGGLVFIAALISGSLSGDMNDSLTSMFGGYTVSAVGLGFFAMIIVAIVARHNHTALWVARALLVASSVLVWWHVLRLLTGWNLSFGLFASQTTSPLGSWTDVALLSAGLVLAILLVISHTSLVQWQRWALVATLGAASFVLVIINNSWLWMVLGIISLTVVVMSITRRQTEPTQAMIPNTQQGTGWLLAAASIVFVGTLAVLLGGDSLQNSLNNLTDSSYVEVRPSITASLDIVRSVWSTDVLTGVGPNRFADAWRMHKSEAINQTIFWNTNFQSGHSFMLTQAVETGLLGLAAWVLFFLLLAVSGVRTFLFASTTVKDTQYVLALASFVLAMFVWISTFFVMVGIPMLLLGWACTGLYVGLSFSIRPRRQLAMSLINNQKLSFVIVASLVMIIIAIVWLLQQMTGQLTAQAAQNRLLTQSTGDIETVSQQLSDIFNRYQNDTTARADALLHVARMRELLNQAQPSATDQQAFQRSSVTAINSATVATQIDPTNPDNWYVQARAYILLTRAELEGAAERAQSAIEQVRILDPKSPQPDYYAAELAVLSGDTEAARAAATAAIQKKRDYTPALTLLAQIEINDGNVEDAIAVTESVLSFEPDNPARWYQLGVLYQANQQTDETIAALTQAIELDSDYANALYVRAIVRYNTGDIDGARADLERVQALNPDNQEVQAQLEALENNDGAAVTGTSTEELPEIDETEIDPTPESVSEAAAETDLITTTTNTADTEAE